MLEIACFNVSSALAAAKSGADRIELCADYAAGGITPALSSLQAVRRITAIPVNIMIRPRGGNFNYTSLEFEQMKREIFSFKSLASGFVFGILDGERHVDKQRNSELIALADPLPCTFHRAIDEVDDLEDAVEDLIMCGFKSILTSGGEKNATEGAGRVAQMQEKFGLRIRFILGGGVRNTNMEELLRSNQVEWLHSAAITKPGEEVDEAEVSKMQHVLSRVA